MAHSWDAVLLPPGYAYGFSGGPWFDVRKHRMDGGGEQRVQILEEPLWRWSALRRNFRNDADVDDLVDFYLARRGETYGFLFLDPADFSTSPTDRVGPFAGIDQLIGFGDGTTTRFKLRKQYSDPGGMSARAFPRRVVPILGTATESMAKVLNVNAGASIAPVATVAGVTDSGAVFLPLLQEVQLSTAPTLGQEVRWGGYFATPARFDNGESGMDATIAGFRSDEAPFEVQSLPFDDPVPLIAGGSPYGYEALPTSGWCELTSRKGFLKEAATISTLSGVLDDLSNYPTGGPHMLIRNTGSAGLTVYDYFIAAVDTIPAGSAAWLFVKEDASGNRTPLLVFI